MQCAGRCCVPPKLQPLADVPNACGNLPLAKLIEEVRLADAAVSDQDAGAACNELSELSYALPGDCARTQHWAPNALVDGEARIHFISPWTADRNQVNFVEHDGCVEPLGMSAHQNTVDHALEEVGFHAQHKDGQVKVRTEQLRLLRDRRVPPQQRGPPGQDLADEGLCLASTLGPLDVNEIADDGHHVRCSSPPWDFADHWTS
mmetsp:Transcript_101939/g.283667  ORF Transcript_101939/g.283667 Transcript_101939/m.283667 type:complete len:204 (+) Transcript_101939:386-997(+)